MTRILAVLAVFAALMSMAAGPAPAEELAQNSGQVCFYNCVQQYGSTAKASCAMQCGLVGDNGAVSGQGGQPPRARDCGSEFKHCRQACGSDQNCQQACREARKQCY